MKKETGIERKRFGDATLLALKSRECGRGKGIQPGQHFDIRTSDFQSYDIIHLYCFEPLNL